MLLLVHPLVVIFDGGELDVMSQDYWRWLGGIKDLTHRICERDAVTDTGTQEVWIGGTGALRDLGVWLDDTSTVRGDDLVLGGFWFGLGCRFGFG